MTNLDRALIGDVAKFSTLEIFLLVEIAAVQNLSFFVGMAVLFVESISYSLLSRNWIFGALSLK